MQKADALEAMKLDLEDTVSVLKKGEYEKALQKAKTLAELRALDFRVRTDAKLRPDHRNQVLQRIERSVQKAVRLTAPPGAGSERVVESATLSTRATSPQHAR